MSCIPYIYIRTRAREACGPSSRRNTLQMSRLAIIFFLIFLFPFFVGASGSWVSAPRPLPRFAVASMRPEPMRPEPMRPEPMRPEPMRPEPMRHALTLEPSSRRRIVARCSSRRAVEPMRQVPSVWACIVRRTKRRRGARAPKPRATAEPRNDFA